MEASYIKRPKSPKMTVVVNQMFADHSLEQRIDKDVLEKVVTSAV